MTAAYLASESGTFIAFATAPGPQPFTYRLLRPCESSTGNDCSPVLDQSCEAAPDRVVRFLTVQSRPLVQPDGTTVDGTPVPAGWPVGEPVGAWQALTVSCVDVTALNPAPSPEEVFRYFERLPLPQLPTHQQPPGNALVGLPVILFTDGPTTQTHTLDIRGFTVDIRATADAFTWHTGDGTALTGTDPGAPYPHHTVTHDYPSGTYTASLTTTWSGTYSVDGGASLDVPGTTTTDGLPVTFTVVEAHAVLTDPYD
ncbi:PKD domain-containing protein [Trujillonella endophytica]|uniref:PKD domain-containing protein n=1 Tax=Trujillonella endophytica TaxID=673521 RepID=UPI001FCE1A4D|nr:PKD domain-containing protein [Trujillella endophytica]